MNKLIVYSIGEGYVVYQDDCGLDLWSRKSSLGVLI